MNTKNATTGPDMLQNLLTHLLSPKVNTIPQLFARSQVAPLDFDLAMWEATDKGLIKIRNGKVRLSDAKFRTELELLDMTELQSKLWRTMLHYEDLGKYVPEVEFFSWAINGMQEEVYRRSAIVGALNWLEDAGLIHSVEAINPAHIGVKRDDGTEIEPTPYKFYYITERSDGVESLFAEANQQAS